MSIGYPRISPRGQRTQHYPFGGGLDLVTPAITKNPGTLIDGVNYEPAINGYRRSMGFERFDGQPSPAETDAAGRAAARALIAPVPGEGDIRGVWLFNGVRYAVRDNVGATEGVLFKATASGWSQVDLGEHLRFDGGIGISSGPGIVAGDTVTGNTSGATATVRHVAVKSGDWANNNAIGLLCLSDITGTFQDGEPLWVNGVKQADCDGTQEASTLPAGGHYEFVNWNFYGDPSRRCMYGVNGVGPAFLFDGTYFCSLETTNTLDLPKHIAAHKDYLWLSFPGGQVQNSGLGEPSYWNAASGSVGYGFGTEVMGLVGSTRDVLTIIGLRRIAAIYGTTTDNFELRFLADNAGGREWSIVHLASGPYFMGDRGIIDMAATQAYGDWKFPVTSRLIEPLLQKLNADGVNVVSSTVIKEKDQAKFFLSNGQGVILDLSASKPAFARFDLGIQVTCACTEEDLDGSEIVLVGADDGFIYQLEKGYSFDGNPVSAYLQLAFNHNGSPTVNKRYHKAHLELDAPPNTSIKFTASFSYGDANLPNLPEQSFDVYGEGALWGAANWGEFYWGSQIEGTAEARIDGYGKNIGMVIASELTEDRPHTIHGLTLHYSLRKLQR